MTICNPVNTKKTSFFYWAARLHSFGAYKFYYITTNDITDIYVYRNVSFNESKPRYVNTNSHYTVKNNFLKTYGGTYIELYIVQGWNNHFPDNKISSTDWGDGSEEAIEEFRRRSSDRFFA